ncbi:MAG: AIM24 family protein [Lachnospiraceae bacterium]|nr:AIM24 family protein [Lachnospiraceae bacterium]MCR5410488.1 AIM24 family protein [Lachnospiraceae bacterium]
MQYSIEGGSLPVVIITLNQGEGIISEVGGRTWSRGDITTETTSNGGAGKALGRMLTGESLFMSSYTANGPAEIAFTSSFPGRIVARELGPGQSVIAQKSAFLCATAGTQLSTYVNKKASTGLVGGEGFLMQKITGPGMAFFEIDGYCKEYDLAPGERIVCDTGVMAIMDETVTMEVQTVKGLKNKLLGGEGLFDTVLVGPGKVSLQTMTVAGIAKLIMPFITKK